MTEPALKLESANQPNRLELMKDIISLQFKLVIDGLRDFILIPVSLVIGFISLVKLGEYPGSGFYDMLRVGKKTERWINLFSAANKNLPPEIKAEISDLEDIDTLLERVEKFAVGGTTGCISFKD